MRFTSSCGLGGRSVTSALQRLCGLRCVRPVNVANSFLLHGVSGPVTKLVARRRTTKTASYGCSMSRCLHRVGRQTLCGHGNFVCCVLPARHLDLPELL